ncbi:MAG: Na/Pi cotransporter family protein [Spirochaetaceae bacterium]|nr:Na/Pi cotransporter family protein [Spirochaetaceae bacterium]
MIFQLGGSLGFLLYGMKLMSDGIQKSAGQTLHRILGFITNNRFMAVLTGALVTLIIQSSSASTVMVVSFVNAGLLTLEQAVGVIFGANIGTTGTAWLISLIGFNIKISAFTIPAFGIGFLLSVIKRLRLQDLGEALMGFALLFLGLEWLSDAIPSIDQTSLEAFLARYSGTGVQNLLIGVLVGTIITIIINSSSAVTAVVITMAVKGMLTWEFAAAITLGSNIGTTTDAPLAAIGASVNAQRAALVHVLFNVFGTVIVCFIFKPMLTFVDFITPGTVQQSIGIHIAMFHTVFNVFSTLIFLPFVKQIAALTQKIIKTKESDIPAVYHFEFKSLGIKDSAEAHIIRLEKEIADMTSLAATMFSKIKAGFSNINEQFTNENIEQLKKLEDYADQMKEEISKYLLCCSDLPMDEKAKNNILLWLNIVNDIEDMTDHCFSVALLLQRAVVKKLTFDTQSIESLVPYMELVQSALDFIRIHINRHLTADDFIKAEDIETQIDTFRNTLKKSARNRLTNGSNVKVELLYIDIVRNIENIGDCAFGISKLRSQIV